MYNIKIADALRNALAAKVTASIGLDAVDDPDDDDGYTLCLAVMVDGVGAHHRDLDAAVEDLAERVAQSVAARFDHL